MNFLVTPLHPISLATSHCVIQPHCQRHSANFHLVWGALVSEQVLEQVLGFQAVEPALELDLEALVSQNSVASA